VRAARPDITWRGRGLHCSDVAPPRISSHHRDSRFLRTCQTRSCPCRDDFLPPPVRRRHGEPWHLAPCHVQPRYPWLASKDQIALGMRHIARSAGASAVHVRAPIRVARSVSAASRPASISPPRHQVNDFARRAEDPCSSLVPGALMVRLCRRTPALISMLVVKAIWFFRHGARSPQHCAASAVPSRLAAGCGGHRCTVRIRGDPIGHWPRGLITYNAVGSGGP